MTPHTGRCWRQSEKTDPDTDTDPDPDEGWMGEGI